MSDTDTKTDDQANADAGAGSDFDAIAANTDPGTDETKTTEADGTKPPVFDKDALVTELAAVMQSEMDRRINRLERTFTKKFGKGQPPKSGPDDDDGDDDDTPPPAAKGPDPRDVRDARRAARTEFRDNYRFVSNDERDFLLDLLDAKVEAHAHSGDMRDPDRDAVRIATDLVKAAKAYRDHMAKVLKDDLRKKGQLVEQPGVSTATGGGTGRASEYAKGAERAKALFPTPTP